MHDLGGTAGVIARYLDGQWEDPQPSAISFLTGEVDRLDSQWPRAGTARDGVAHRRRSKVHDEGYSWGSHRADLMWPTPRLGGSNRNSRQAIVNTKGHPSGRSSVGLEQAVEIAFGLVPKEFKSVAEVQEHSSASRYWPTPCASDEKGSNKVGQRRRQLSEAILKYPLWPTPTTQDAKNNGTVSQQERNSKPLNALVVLHPEGEEIEPDAPKTPLLNARFVELLMGFPEGWTDVG